MCIADIYEALVAKDRPYKPPLSREESLSILEREVKEGKIDSELFAVFKENLDAIVGTGTLRFADGKGIITKPFTDPAHS